MSELAALVARLLAARAGSDRIAVVSELEQLGAPSLAAAARVVLRKDDGDAVALVCRALIRHARTLPGTDRLLDLLASARRTVGDRPIASAAIDDALLALGGIAAATAMLPRLAELEPAQASAVIKQLRERPAEEAALHAPALLEVLARAPELWPTIGPALAHVAAHVRDGARDELRKRVEHALGELRAGKTLAPITLVSLCWILARIAEQGESLPRPLRLALGRLASAEAARALCALCARLGTEEAAFVLIAMLDDPMPEAQRSAQARLTVWQSPWVRIELADPPVFATTYTDAAGQPLERRQRRLVAPTGDVEYVLDARGRPIRASESEHGGCLCCGPPRALVHRRGDGLHCTSGGELYLLDGAAVVREREHPAGRCRVCHSPRARLREGTRTYCAACGAGRGADPRVDDEGPALPEQGSHDELPTPPTADELQHMAPHVRRAITANVFLRARVGAEGWNGSGIVIARDGNWIAILTNRHVVEHDQTQQLVPLTALSVAGEAIAMSTVWRAGRGVDLAIVEGRAARPDGLGVMELGTGEAFVGAQVFAIGNPLGLAWSYTAGTLSAIRHWTTAGNLSVRILQTDARISPGSSGGGLFHGDGHLLGVSSWTRQAVVGGDSANFAYSIAAIREALARDNVRWRGRLLADLP